MEDQQQPPAKGNQAGKSETERTKQVTAAAWTAGVSAFFLMGALASNASWPMASGVIAVAAMVATVCYFILKQ